MKKILITIDWFLPGYKAGGPITSIYNIINNFHDNYDFYVITSDRDLNDTEPYKNIETNIWIKRDNFQIMYLSKNGNKFKIFNDIISNSCFSIIYFNSLFSKDFTLIPILILKFSKIKIKKILAPRGMLGKGAISLKKNKKKFFIFITKLFKFYNDITWHVTNIQEKEDLVTNYGVNQNITIATNISSLKLNEKQRNIEKPVKLFFYSRISEKKNLDFALNILSKINSNQKFTFDIIGPIEDEVYWKKCKLQIEAIGDKININQIGSISPDEIYNKLQEYHFLFLPTKHENYGHVIIESLSSNCPVIISNQTPWRNLEEKKIGWDIDLKDEEKFREVIEYCLNISEEEYNKMSENCYNFAKKINEDKRTKELYLELFQ